MRARTAYAAGIALLAGWLVIAHSVAAITHHLALAGRLGPIGEALATGNKWGLRMTPWVVVGACLLGTPLLAWFAPRLLNPSFPGGARVRDVVLWMTVATVSWIGALLLDPAQLGDLLSLFWWSAALAGALVVGVACLVQSRLQRLGRSRIPASAVRYGGVALQALLFPGGSLVGFIPVLSSLGDRPSNKGMHQPKRRVEDAPRRP